MLIGLPDNEPFRVIISYFFKLDAQELINARLETWRGINGAV